MKNTPLYYLTIAEAAELIRKHALSPVELTQAFLHRIESMDGQLHAYNTVTAELALKEAGAAETAIMRGDYRGPLHGIPIAVKDLCATRGVLTTASSRVLLNWVPDEDATVVARLKGAGAFLLGKLAMHQFAFGGPNFKGSFPVARNPWNQDHIPFGSSSGSGTAVAAGMCMGSLGSDTGGSIRGPASGCGILGLKPTYGRVSLRGVIPLSWSMDSCGPMTWTVQDAALMLQAIAGYDPEDRISSKAPVPNYSSPFREDVKGLVLGIPRQHFFDPDTVDPEVLAGVENAVEVLRELGAKTKPVDLPDIAHVNSVWDCIVAAEAYAYHEANIKSQPENYDGMVLERIRGGAFYSAADYIQAQRLRTLVQRDFANLMLQVDALAAPTTPQPATRVDQITPLTRQLSSYCTKVFSVTGMPALSICCGFTSNGLPIGLQIAGRPFDELTVLRIAHAYERNTPWHHRRPPI